MALEHGQQDKAEGHRQKDTYRMMQELMKTGQDGTAKHETGQDRAG